MHVHIYIYIERDLNCMLNLCLFCEYCDSVYDFLDGGSLGLSRTNPMLSKSWLGFGILYKDHDHTNVECLSDVNWIGS